MFRSSSALRSRQWIVVLTDFPAVGVGFNARAFYQTENEKKKEGGIQGIEGTQIAESHTRKFTQPCRKNQ